MALNFVPGLDAVTVPITTAASVAKVAVGDENYQRIRSTAAWSGSLFTGFVPVNPMLWPVQISLYIVCVLMLIFVFGCGVGKAFLWAYIVQALCVACMTHWFADKFLRYGLAV